MSLIKDLYLVRARKGSIISVFLGGAATQSMHRLGLNIRLCLGSCCGVQDFCKLAGITAPRQRLPALEQLLSDTRSTLEQVMDFLMS